MHNVGHNPEELTPPVSKTEVSSSHVGHTAVGSPEHYLPFPFTSSTAGLPPTPSTRGASTESITPPTDISVTRIRRQLRLITAVPRKELNDADMQARKIIALDRDLKTQAPQALDAKHPMHPARAACLEATVDLFRDFMRKECLPFITRDPPRRDLVEAAAHEGMYKAFIRFDPERDIPFSIFARRTVRGTIQNAMRSETLSGSPLSRQDYEAHKDLLKGIHAAAQETHQVVPTNEAVARSSGLSTELVRQSRAAHHIIANTVSLDQPINSLPGSTPLQDTLAAKTDTPDETTQTLWRVLSSLPLDSRERVILDRRFGIEVTEGRLTLWVDHTPDTQTELSASLGISQVHVSRLIARLIRKIEREIILESKGTTLPTLRLDVTPHVDK